MSARDDYPLIGGWEVDPTTYVLMCEEIDRLRAGGSEHQAICVPIEAAKDELIRELTAHADAMREALMGARQTIRDLSDQQAMPDFFYEGTLADIDTVVSKYDAFVKEC